MFNQYCTDALGRRYRSPVSPGGCSKLMTDWSKKPGIWPSCSDALAEFIPVPEYPARPWAAAYVLNHTTLAGTEFTSTPAFSRLSRSEMARIKLSRSDLRTWANFLRRYSGRQ